MKHLLSTIALDLLTYAFDAAGEVVSRAFRDDEVETLSRRVRELEMELEASRTESRHRAMAMRDMERSRKVWS